ncbi:MAG: hypothetical protein KDC38_02825 [Planctomycetes bacterium]|nr:hypothetical protein [Planctomycetota bacterium]
MYGALRPPRLDAQDRLLYRSSYCAGCHALRQWGGRSLSLLTTYDQTFWVLTYAGLSEGTSRCAEGGETSTVEWRPCTALPFRRVPVRTLPAEVAERMARVSTLLADAKLLDDLADDARRGRRWMKRLVRGWLSARVRRARRELGDSTLAGRLDAWPAQQARVESRGSSLEELIAPTRETLAELFAEIASLEPPLRDLGDGLGEAIYLFDALNDFERDRRRGEFNALAATGSGPCASLASKIEACFQQVDRALDRLPLEIGHRRVLDRVVLRLRHRTGRAWSELVAASRSPFDTLPARWVPQAGVCDALECCSCEGAECCAGGTEGCGGAAECCTSGESGATVCELCTCCDCCLCWDAELRRDRREKRKERRQRRAQESGESRPPYPPQ